MFSYGRSFICIHNFSKFVFFSAELKAAIAEHFVNNQSFAKNFSLDQFKTIKNCCIVFDLVTTSGVRLDDQKIFFFTPKFLDKNFLSIFQVLFFYKQFYYLY